jgi:hypothetical protein
VERLLFTEPLTPSQSVHAGLCNFNQELKAQEKREIGKWESVQGKKAYSNQRN